MGIQAAILLLSTTTSTVLNKKYKAAFALIARFLIYDVRYLAGEAAVGGGGIGKFGGNPGGFVDPATSGGLDFDQCFWGGMCLARAEKS